MQTGLGTGYPIGPRSIKDPSRLGTGTWNRGTQSVQDRSVIHPDLEPGYPIGPRSISDPSRFGTGVPNWSKIDQRSIQTWNRGTQSVQDRSKIHPDLEPGYPIGPISINLEPGYPIGLRSISDPSRLGTGVPNRSKIDQRSIQTWNRGTQSVQDRSKIHPDLEPGYPIGPRSIKDPSTVGIGPRSISDPSRLGTGVPNWSKIDQRSIQTWNRGTQLVQDRSVIHPDLEPGYPIGPRLIKDPSRLGTGVPNRSKIDQRSIQTWNRVGIGPRSISDPSRLGTGVPNWSKIDQRSIQTWNRGTQLVQDRSVIHPDLEPGYPIGPRSIKDPSTVGIGPRSINLEPGYPIGPRSIKDPSRLGTGVPNQPLKRRKLNDSSGSQTIVVSCTAFIHVYVYNDGSHTAIFCLDHTCGSDSNNAKINTKANTKCHKRNHDEMMREDLKDGRRYSNPEANNNNNNGELTSCEDLPESARSTLADLPESSKIPMRYGEEVKRKNASTASDPPDMGTLLESINEGLSQAHIKGGRSHSVEQTTYEPEAMDVVNRAAETATETCPCA
ncbi:hypothetical protein L596_018716 [Steinernema carpocapsae]|uniref:Uncharacterized protein n=1 Tax=Steinernema carpocapsae TaxID=34508 RepID=A0A4V6A243_STECR|nr:hypothetical protein L596_018716 [Steinernema carpocapsae]